MRTTLMRQDVSVPVNLVRACQIELEMKREYSKAEWRQATQIAMARWRAQGGKVEKVRNLGTPRRRGFYID